MTHLHKDIRLPGWGVIHPASGTRRRLIPVATPVPEHAAGVQHRLSLIAPVNRPGVLPSSRCGTVVGDRGAIDGHGEVADGHEGEVGGEQEVEGEGVPPGPAESAQ